MESPQVSGPGKGHPAKRAQQIAEAIEREIVDAAYPAGHHLGTESDLLNRHGGSRSVLREALVLVEGSGLAEVRRGHRGGLFVVPPSVEMVAAGLQGYLSCISGDFEAIRIMRREIEDLALALAIRRFQPADIVAYTALIERFDRTPGRRERRAIATEMLGVLARTGRNPIVTVLVLAFASSAVEQLTRKRGVASRLLDIAERTTHMRREQMLGVLGSDAGRALAASAAYHELSAQMHAMPDSSERETDFDATEALVLSATGFAEARKLADVVARRLRERIARENLAEGDRIGSEPELMERYGVSRGVFREAVRILERLSLVRMVRGKHGGLRVARPRAEAIVRSSSLYLRSLQVQMKHCQELAEAMGLVAVEHAARNVGRFTPESIEAILEPLHGLKGATLKELAFAHYNVIGKLSGSRSIGLVMSILANLYQLDDTPENPDLVVREIVPQRLADMLAAILAGDQALARRRMIILQRSGARVRALSVGEIVQPRLLDVLDGP